MAVAPDPYEVVRDVLTADGWDVGPRQKKGRFDLTREGRHVIAVVASGPEPGQTEAAYRRLLAAKKAQPEADLAVVVSPAGYRQIHLAQVDVTDRLDVAVLIVDESGRMFESLAETIASADLPRGPALWRSWLAQRTGFSRVQREEFALYSDSAFVGEISLGPLELVNTTSRQQAPAPGVAEQTLVLRYTSHVPRTSSLLNGPPKVKDVAGYYEGYVGDELAALLSLALNVRCRTGGLIRVWWPPDDLDGPGRPFTFYHRAPLLQPPRYDSPMLPGVTRAQINLDEARPLLELYGTLNPRQAVTLVRAARQFQDAVWIADDSPAQSWLMLVSALETAASLMPKQPTGLESLRELRPLWAGVLETATHDRADEAIKEISRETLVLAKIRRLLVDHPPAPPEGRAQGVEAIDWNQLESLILNIYGLRSDALHRGLPLPEPLLGPYMPRSDPPPVRPTGSIGSGDSVWTENDMPMYLHTFAHIVGEILRSWWRALPES